MVRTYAFNPSTQSALSSTTHSLPVLTPTAVMVHSASLQHPHSHFGPREDDYQLVGSRGGQMLQQHQMTAPPPDPPPQARKFPHIVEADDRHRQHQRTMLPPSSELESSSSGVGSSSTASSANGGSQQVLMEEERTTLLSIRSVLINGHRFFQPTSFSPGAIPADPSTTAAASSHQLVAIAAVNNSNGQQHQQHLHHPHNQPQVAPPPPSTMFPARTVVPPPPAGIAEEDDVPPWARGNPQPKNGQRGSREWQAGFSFIQPKQSHHPPFEATFASSDRSGGGDRTEQERHRMELLAQIEENRQRRMRERQRDWELEEKERVKNELYQQRVQMELEEERRREREKALLAELKAAKLAAAQRATEDALREARLRQQGQPPRQQQQRAGGGGGRARGQSLRSDSLEAAGASIGVGHREGEEEEEWWERKDRRRREAATNIQQRRGQSPVIPALQQHAPRSISAESRRSGGGKRSRNSRLAYEPSVARRSPAPNSGTHHRRQTPQGESRGTTPTASGGHQQRRRAFDRDFDI